MNIEWPKKYISWIDKKILYISAPFTWELPKIRRLLIQKSFNWEKAIVGGPAIYLMPKYLEGIKNVVIKNNYEGVLQRINPMATKTTIGCVRRCGFCGVWRFEGKFKELNNWPDLPIICDNNLLASSRKHFDKVIDRLLLWDFSDFNQGIDTRLLTNYHAKRFSELKNTIIRLALDDFSYKDQWQKAHQKLRKVGLPNTSIRSYALIGFDSGPEEAWQRCEWITKQRVLVLPQWYHSLNQLKKNIVTKEQEKLGWNDFERVLIMRYYYQRGANREFIRKNYKNRLNS